MDYFIKLLNEKRKIFINNKELMVLSLVKYNTLENADEIYYKAILSDQNVLVISDDVCYIGKIYDDLKYVRKGQNFIEYNKTTFSKVADGHQQVIEVIFGNEEEVEKECYFQDYETDQNIISLGVLKNNEIADVYAKYINIKDIKFKK